MMRLTLLLAILLCCSTSASSDTPKRPRILGIAAVTILTSDIPGARAYYRQITDPSRSCNWCEDIPSSTISLGHSQTVTFKQLPSQPPSSLLEEVTFRTDSLDQLAKFLRGNRVDFREQKYNGQLWRISLLDPEGHAIAFAGIVKPLTSMADLNGSSGAQIASPKIIHAGFVVRDRNAEDHFYQDILGFRMYWHGGMKDDQTDWVDMQVPDGTDWIEYMLHVPANADHHTLGVMNHIALGVPDVHAAQKQLLERGVKLTEEPKIGRDGKWQLNVYDPDDTRVEFMEFTPVGSTCCSEFNGPHPGPHP
jgi:catechol 2,3-dioxygenase-like lactoylglutathione lyase family enzyme